MIDSALTPDEGISFGRIVFRIVFRIMNSTIYRHLKSDLMAGGGPTPD